MSFFEKNPQKQEIVENNCNVDEISDTIREEIAQKSLAMDKIRLSQDRLSMLHLEDPAAYEELLEQGAIDDEEEDEEI